MATPGKKILKYPEERMVAAIAAVKEGLGLKKAARQFDVPKTTLLYKVRGVYPEKRKMGPETIFSIEEEKLLSDWVLSTAKAGFPVSKENFLISVTRLARELNKTFKNDIPGRKWYEAFMKRHPEITLRVSQNLTKSRSEVTSEKLENWFQEVEQFLEETNQKDILNHPKRIFNADESAFFLNPKGGKVLAKKGDKNVYNNINNDEKECLTVLITGSAAGIIAPPLVIFRYKRIPNEIAKSIPKDWGVGCSENGWMTCDTFYSYMTNVFYPWAKENTEFPVIFFVDGHCSHLSYHLSEFCQNHGIILIALYPNATHLIQPMDVAVFKTLKASWKEKVLTWRVEHQSEILKRHNFAPLLQRAIDEKVTVTVLENGFRKCGLYPWDPSSAVKIVENRPSNPPTPRDKNDRVLPSKKFDQKRHLAYFESFINSSTLEFFQSSPAGEQFTGPVNDLSLFKVWRKMQQEVSKLDEQANITENNEQEGLFDLSFSNLSEIEMMTNTSLNLDDLLPEYYNQDVLPLEDGADENSPQHSTHDSFKHNSDKTVQQSKLTLPLPISEIPIVINVPSEPNIHTVESTNQEIDEPVTICSESLAPFTNMVFTPQKNSNSSLNIENNCLPSTSKHDSVLIPSPFKRALFYPAEKIETAKKRKTEKIPSVVTSKQWQDYNKKKIEEKEKKLKEKEEKKKLREIKANEKLSLKNTKTKTKKKTSKIHKVDSDISDSEGSLSSDHLSETLTDFEGNLYNVKDYVVTEYEGEFFPGQIEDKRESKDGTEFLISVMAMSGPSGWRWPEKKDVIWYQMKSVVGKIDPPTVANSRGVCLVPAMRKLIAQKKK